MKLLRKNGWLAEVVERWIPYINIRKDLFGFIDVIAVKGNMVCAVQTTSTANINARVKKIIDEPRAKTWLLSPTRSIVVHGWDVQGKKGKRKALTCKSVYISSINGEIVASVDDAL